ncbi:MAG: acetyl-CoA acetyltransferase [Planctomycetota bacterium]|nr:MAG: acetyl-CoA acetyltransferase [Planctomycetota bacterium]
MAADDDILILGGARTPMAEYAGTPGFGLFKDHSAIELGAIAARAALERTRVEPRWIEHVIFGNVQQTSADAIYGARHLALKAGVPAEVPAVTVNRLCGSGIEAVIQAAHRLRLGEAQLVLAGGTENMSQAPHVIRGLRAGLRFGQQPALEDSLFQALYDPMCGLYMAQTAEKLARKYDISRAAQDAYALRSHRLGVEATDRGVFRQEIVPVEVETRQGKRPLDFDDHIKRDTSLEKLAALRPAFGKDGTVTAGNASGIVDGAAALVLGTRKAQRERDLPVLGRVHAWAVVGVDPSIMGIGPAPAIRAVLNKAGLRLEQIDLFEINEAFAAQYLAVEKELGLERERVNVNGGAIAIGHPLGATGARLILTLLMELGRRGGRWGIASACIGGGQGIAILLENEAAG